MVKIFAAIGAIQVVSILASILRSKLLAVMLGPEGVGVISVVDQVVQLASYLSACSLPYAAVKFLSRSHSISHEAFLHTYTTFLKILLLFSVFGISVLVALALTVPSMFGEELGKYNHYLAIAAFGLPAMMLGGFFNNVLASAQRPKSASVLNVINAVVFLLAALIGVSLANIYGFYIAHVSAGLVIIMGVIIYFQKRMDLSIFKQKTNVLSEFKQNPDIIGFSVTMSITAVAYSGSYLVARYSVLNHYSESEAGLLHALISIAMAVGMILGPINGYLLTPKLNRNISRAEKIQTANNFLRILAFILVLTAVPFTLFPKTAIFILFSSEFISVSQYLFVFVLAATITHIVGVYQALIIGFDDIKGFATITTTCHLTLGAVSWLLVPSLGVLGVGYGFLAASLLSLFLFFSRLRIKYDVIYPAKELALMGYSLMAIFAFGYVSAQFEEFDLTTAAIKIVVFLLFTVSLVLFLSKNEKNTLAQIIGAHRSSITK